MIVWFAVVLDLLSHSVESDCKRKRRHSISICEILIKPGSTQVHIAPAQMPYSYNHLFNMFRLSLHAHASILTRRAFLSITSDPNVCLPIYLVIDSQKLHCPFKVNQFNY